MFFFNDKLNGGSGTKDRSKARIRALRSSPPPPPSPVAKRKNASIVFAAVAASVRRGQLLPVARRLRTGVSHRWSFFCDLVYVLSRSCFN